MKKSITLLRKSVMAFALLSLPIYSMAQAGSLDLTFDTDGIVTTAIGTLNDAAQSVVVQNDGKILVVGSSKSGSYNRIALVRYNLDGSLDNTFDIDGIVTTDIGTSSDAGYSVIIQPDGKILVTGISYNGSNPSIAVVRYNINGSLDNTFDTDGIVTTVVGPTRNFGYAMALQSDGKIVVSGLADNGIDDDIVVLRYNVNGSLDNTFDGDGIVITDIDSSDEQGDAVAIQNDGKIVVAGDSYVGIGDKDFVTLRYNTDGSLDNTFGVNGIAITAFGPKHDIANAIAIQSDNKILVGGAADNGSNWDFALARYNTDGNLDNSFDLDGKVVTPIGASTEDVAKSIVIQSDGKIVIAGHADNSSTGDIALTRYKSNGMIDSTFDLDGICTTIMGSSNSAFGESSTIQSDGKLIVAGFFHEDITNTNKFIVTRYNNNINLGINDDNFSALDNTIYPNPLIEQTTLYTKRILLNATINLYNIFGQQVKQLKSINGHSVIINRENLPSGIYSIVVTEDKKIISNNKLTIMD